MMGWIIVGVLVIIGLVFELFEEGKEKGGNPTAQHYHSKSEEGE